MREKQNQNLWHKIVQVKIRTYKYWKVKWQISSKGKVTFIKVKRQVSKSI